MYIHCFVFKIQLIKDPFLGPKPFRDFRETGPRTDNLPDDQMDWRLWGRGCVFQNTSRENTRYQIPLDYYQPQDTHTILKCKI